MAKICSVEVCDKAIGSRSKTGLCKLHYDRRWRGFDRANTPSFRSKLTSEHYGSRMYTTWCGMKARCNNPKTRFYKNYGGRGIVYDNKWETFDGFYEDMSVGYRDDLTLERIDVNGNYTKDNCTWADYTTQANNRRNSRHITIGDETKTLTEWIRHFGLKPSTVRQRYYVYGWKIEKALEIGG